MGVVIQLRPKNEAKDGFSDAIDFLDAWRKKNGFKSNLYKDRGVKYPLVVDSKTGRIDAGSLAILTGEDNETVCD